MADVDEVRRDTRDLLGLEVDEGLEHITPELIAEFEALFIEEPEAGITVFREDGSPATEEDIAEFGPEATRTYYGNRYARIGTCFYWKTNGVGQPCGTGFSARACNWRSAGVAWVQSCPGGFSGYRFTFTY